jgi:hypothetical protein
MDRYLPGYFRYLVGLIAALLISNGIIWPFHQSRARRTDRVVSELTKAKALAEQISNLKQSIPSRPENDDQNADPTSFGRVRSILKDAQVSEEKISSLVTRDRSRVQTTAFERVDTTVLLNDIDLESLLRFVARYETSGKRSVCSRLEIRTLSKAPSSGQSTWIADITLTDVLLSETR